MSKALNLIDAVDSMFRKYCDENKSIPHHADKLACLIQRRLELTVAALELAESEVKPEPVVKSFLPLNAISKGIDIQLTVNGSMGELLRMYSNAAGHVTCKIPLIKFIREHTGCGLKEGKDYIDTKFEFNGSFNDVRG